MTLMGDVLCMLKDTLRSLICGLGAWVIREANIPSIMASLWPSIWLSLLSEFEDISYLPLSSPSYHDEPSDDVLECSTRTEVTRKGILTGVYT